VSEREGEGEGEKLTDEDASAAGYWNFEVCHRKRIRQFHEENRRASVEYSLGDFDRMDSPTVSSLVAALLCACVCVCACARARACLPACLRGLSLRTALSHTLTHTAGDNGGRGAGGDCEALLRGRHPL
jgi:hypothetical protein